MPIAVGSETRNNGQIGPTDFITGHGLADNYDQRIGVSRRDWHGLTYGRLSNNRS